MKLMENKRKYHDKAIDALADSIERYIKHYVKSLSFDVTTRGIVTAVLGGNKYKVKVQGTEMTVLCATEQTFSVNDVVFVLSPQNNMVDAHIIGKAGR